MDDVLDAINAGRRELSRYRVLAELDRIDALVRAIELFAEIYPVAPEAVPEAVRPACEAIWAGREEKAYAALHDQAIDLLAEAERTHDRATIDQAIWFLVMAVLGAVDDPLLPGYLSHLGTAWADRFRVTARVADLDNALAAHRKSLALPILRVADQAGFRANYSTALRIRYEVTGETGDLDQAVMIARQAADTARPAWASGRGNADLRSGLVVSLQNIVAALVSRFQLSRDRADLDDAIITAREGIAVTGPADPEYPTLQGLLASALLERFARYRELPDLTEALTAAQDGANAAESGSPVRAVCLSSLALAQGNLFGHTGDVRDLDRAIVTGRESVTAARGEPLGMAICLSNLGGILRTKYERLGDAGALDEAIETHRAAVRNTPAGHVNLPGFLSNLGSTLRNRFEVGGSPADLQESIEVLGRAVANAHRDQMDRPGYVANLANALIAAAEQRVDPGALDRAIAMLGTEIAALSVAHPLRHLCLASAGYAWRTWFDCTGDSDALDKAIDYLGQAAESVSAVHPQRAEYLAVLGVVWHQKFERSQLAGQPDRAAGTAAMKASTEAASTVTAPPLTRALAARNWAQAAARLDNRIEAARGFAAAVDLLDRVAWRGLRRGDQERQLGRFTALACDAAAWAIETGQEQRAVELLEQGRGVLLAQSLDDRARKHDLYRADPELARQLTDIDSRLDSVPSAADLMPADGTGPAAERDDLSRCREEVLGRIRRLAGFSDFLRTPRFEVLREASRSGPVVIVNVSGYRCDALIVTMDGVRVIPLAAVTGEAVVRHVADFLVALQSLQRAELSYAEWDAAQKTVTATLAWLWDAIMSLLLPSLLAAARGSSPGRPRVWWCPTGPLTFLPLHAAGRHDGDSVLDHFMSSYALTLRLLLRARDRARQRADDARTTAPMIVVQPSTPGQQPLPYADLEADVFTARFPGARQFDGPAATLTDVKAALEQSPAVAHFACHGTQDVTSPSSGHLALHDGQLGTAEVANMRLDSAELAFLSACETSRGGVDLADEAITVAAAFHLAGYRHVIGTLWSISDKLAPDIARHVYDRLRLAGTAGLDTTGTAAALDAAIRSVRGNPETGPCLWAPYVHLGP